MGRLFTFTGLGMLLLAFVLFWLHEFGWAGGLALAGALMVLPALHHAHQRFVSGPKGRWWGD